jgi:hypothetical protein
MDIWDLHTPLGAAFAYGIYLALRRYGEKRQARKAAGQPSTEESFAKRIAAYIKRERAEWKRMDDHWKRP